MTTVTLAGGIAIAMLLATSASASNPPARYAHHYSGRLIEHSGTSIEVARACARIGFKNRMGCSTGDVSGACTIWYVNDPRVAGGVRRHEIAHCNGWPASHPR